ncbi:hypothetical protein [Candidatus Planktophila dulcis]|uniref:hypothetical protein n=1 Tax=Candidatus Planktophila dulcis TaxID=1884914 RepID=UPI003CF13638
MSKKTNIVFAPKFSGEYLKLVQNLSNPALLLIENSTNRDLWIKALTKHNLVDIYGLIQENARANADEFNNSIADHLWKSPESLSILTRTFERNTLTSKLFQDCIFAISGNQIIQGNPHVTIISDRIGVAKDLSNSRESNIRIRYKTENLQPGIQIFRDSKRILKFSVWFTGNLLAVRKLESPNAKIILHSFADRETQSTNQYEERYFPGLHSKFKHAGYEPSMYISNAGSYPRKLWLHLIDAGMNPTLEFKYLKPRMLLSIVWKAFKIRKSEKSDFRIAGTLLNETFKQSFKESRFDLGTLQALTRYYSLNQLVSKRTPTEELIFLCEYEGMQLEKAAALTRNRFPERLKIVGIQHGTIFKNLLCTFPTNWDFENSMLPDKIVCNGAQFEKILSSAKIAKEILEVGPALRYGFLHEHSGEKSLLNGKIIFVPLPLTKNQEIKTIEFIEQALGSSSFQVLFKPHPISTTREELEACITRHSNFALTVREFSSLLGEIGVVVSQTTGSLLEFALLGYPVIRISNPYEIEFNSLESLEKGVMQVLEPHELESAILTSMTNVGTLNDSTETLESYFYKSKDFDLRIFLPSKII